MDDYSLNVGRFKSILGGMHDCSPVIIYDESQSTEFCKRMYRLLRADAHRPVVGVGDMAVALEPVVNHRDWSRVRLLESGYPDTDPPIRRTLSVMLKSDGEHDGHVVQHTTLTFDSTGCEAQRLVDTFLSAGWAVAWADKTD